MANNYSVSFKSLRTGTIYTINIGGGTGAAIPLTGGAQPFTTQENSEEDQFLPVRTQSGYIRIVDNGKDANGNAFNWKDLIPATDTERPVLLTHNESGTTVVDWQGFMQSQTFNGVLYGNPQEREFPIQCCLGAVNGVNANINNGLQNFAFVIKEVCDIVASKSGNVIDIDTFMIQGGEDARQWLLNRIDWQMFATEDKDGVLEPKTTLNKVLEDMCQFWGWTARTHRKTFYLTRTDDQAEQDYLQLTRAQLNTLAAASTDTTTGTIISGSNIPTVTLSDTQSTRIFASTNQDDCKVQGPHKATVKASVNQIDTILEFMPQTVRDELEDSGYSWVSIEDNKGYFTTPTIYSINDAKLIGSANSNFSGFVRRQIYSNAMAESATICDEILFKQYYNGSVFASLQTTRQMPFGAGSLKLSGSVYKGVEKFVADEWSRSFVVHIGIGMTRATAKWMHLSGTMYEETIDWTSSPSEIYLSVSADPKLWVFAWGNGGVSTRTPVNLQSIPLKEDLYGYLFIDFMGSPQINYIGLPPQWELANFSVTYGRDEEILATGGVSRKITRDRKTTAKYSASNNNASNDEWNADCIFATDNNLEYGYGLLVDSGGNIIADVPYGNSRNHPEQQLANRVANYWNAAKRKVSANVITDAVQTATSGNVLIGNILPYYKISADQSTFTPIAFSREWRDDTTTITLLEMPTS